MSPIIDLQRRMRELGRIRTGVQVPSKNGKRRPEKLDTFRLTSASRELLDAAALVYGGTVEPWPEQGEFQLTTRVDAFDILVPPGQTLSQWYELWSGGGCQRRCDGRTNVITDEPCSCPAEPAIRRELAADGRACRPTTRLNVIVPALPDLGVWRLESHGYYAAVELSGTAAVLESATASGRMLPARLRLDQRERKVPGKPTARYSVPVIELPQTRMADLVASGMGAMPALGGSMDQATVTVSPAPQIAAPGPEEPKRVSARRQRVERPPIGAAPALPDGSGHERPTPSYGRSPEPDRVAGWVVEEGDPGPTSPAPAPPGATETAAGGVTAAATHAPSPDAGAPADGARGLTSGLSFEVFSALVRNCGATEQHVIDAARYRFPEAKRLSGLTDEQRGLLFADIEDALAGDREAVLT